METQSHKSGKLSHLMACASVLLCMTAVAPAAADNTPPPPGALLDLDGTPISASPTLYAVQFTAASASTDITFALRDDSAYLSFSNTSLVDLTHPGGNLFVNPNFTGSTYAISGQTVLIPTGWNFSNQSQAAYSGTVSNTNCQGGGTCWFDGSVQAYDALDQTVATTIGDTYQISFELGEDGSHATYSRLSTNGYPGAQGNGVDVLAYAQAGLPPTLTNPVPEPGTHALMMAGLAALGVVTRRRTGLPGAGRVR